MEISHSLKQQFLLDPDVTYLNFGSFGACPQPIFDDYIHWQKELERNPVKYITRTGPQQLQRSREALGTYIGCNAEDVVFVPNPTYGANIIAKSLNLKPGDEIITTNLEYGACDKTWQYYCKKSGATYVRQKTTLPVVSKQHFIDEFVRGITSKTKMLFISHITSTTGLILPVEELCAVAKQKGILTFVDGAHVPGHIPLDLKKLQADMYIGACHKWMMTPKGSSFLYVKKELQPLFDPLIVSWGYESAMPSTSIFLDYHQMSGTRDFSAYLTIPKAIEFMKQNNWPHVAAQCRKLVKDNAARFCELLQTQPLCPVNDEFLGQMMSIPIVTRQPEKLQQHLYEQHKIEIPVMRLDDKIFLRYSIQAFNTQSDLDRLFDVVREIICEKELIVLPN